MIRNGVGFRDTLIAFSCVIRLVRHCSSNSLLKEKGMVMLNRSN